MRNSDRMQDTFERFLPKPQKGPQPMEIRVEVVVLPDVSFALATSKANICKDPRS